MASLNAILTDKANDVETTLAETNMEVGTLNYFTPGTMFSDAHTCFCWLAPANGQAIIEVWGASGTGAAQCCCSYGMAGNPGGWGKKTITMTSGQMICGHVGRSCHGSSSFLCVGGLSEPTCICWVSSTGNGTVCAGGGQGGYSYCSGSGNSIYCCFVARGHPVTQYGSSGCGVVCNYCASQVPSVTGADVTYAPLYSKVNFGHCNSCCHCSHVQCVALSPGLGSTKGGYLMYSSSMNGYGKYRPAGGSLGNQITALESFNRKPVGGGRPGHCWSGGQLCSCYEYEYSCKGYLPHGVPGGGTMPCEGVRDYGVRGGHGAVRIQFIAS